MPTPYAVSSDLVSAWPAKSLAVATYLDGALAAKLGTLTVNAQTGTTYTLLTTDPQKVVTMTNAAASAVTIPTNAAQAVTIGSQIEVVNLSTGVACTVAPAGGVTLHGGSVVLSPGSSVTVAKIATDVWMVQGQGAPGMTLLATATASAASSVSVNNCFSAAYDNYLILINSTVAAGSVYANMRLRASGTDNSTASSYITQECTYDSTTVGAVRSTSDKARLLNISATAESSFAVTVYKPAVAAHTKMTSFGYYGYSNATMYNAVAMHTQTVAYDGFTVYPDSSTLTSAVRVYGYRNA